MVGVLLVAIFILLAVFLFWIMHKEGQWLSWALNPANQVPLSHKLVTGVLLVGLVWLMSRS